MQGQDKINGIKRELSESNRDQIVAYHVLHVRGRKTIVKLTYGI